MTPPPTQEVAELRRELFLLENFHHFVHFSLLSAAAAEEDPLGPRRLSEVAAQLVRQTVPAASAKGASVQLYVLLQEGEPAPCLLGWLGDEDGGERLVVEVLQQDDGGAARGNDGDPVRLALEGESEVDPVLVTNAPAPTALLSRVVDRSGEVLGLVQIVAASASAAQAAAAAAAAAAPPFGPADAEALSELQDQLATVLLLLRLLHQRRRGLPAAAAGPAASSSLFLPSPSQSPERQPSAGAMGVDVLARALAEERAEGERLREKAALLEGKYKQAKRELRGLQKDWEAQTRQLEGQAEQAATRREQAEGQWQRRGKEADAARRLLGSAVAGVWRALEEASVLTDLQSVSERMAAALLHVLVPAAAVGAPSSPARNGGGGAAARPPHHSGARILFVAGQAEGEGEGEGGGDDHRGPLVLTTAAGLLGAAEGNQPQQQQQQQQQQPPASPTQTSPTRSLRRRRRMEVVPGSLTEAALLDPHAAPLLVSDARKDERYTAACDGGGWGGGGGGGAGSSALALIPLHRRAFLPEGSCQGAEPMGVVQLWGPTAGASGGGGGGGEDGGMAALLRLGQEDAQSVLSTLGALLSLVLEWCLAGRRGSRLRSHLLQGAAQLLPLPAPAPLGAAAAAAAPAAATISHEHGGGLLTPAALQAWVDRLLPSLWAAGPGARVRSRIRLLDPAAWGEEEGPQTGAGGDANVNAKNGSASPLPSPVTRAKASVSHGISAGSLAEEAVRKGRPALALGHCLVAYQQRARQRARQGQQRHDEEEEEEEEEEDNEAGDEEVAAAAVLATRVVEALLERGGCSVRGPPSHASSTSTRLLTLCFPLRAAEGQQALGVLEVELRACPSSSSSSPSSPWAADGGSWGIQPACVQLEALQQVATGLLGPALGRALARRQAAARLRTHEAAQDRRLSELQLTVDDVTARQAALRQANDALATENDRLAGALGPLRGEHEALLTKYHRLKLGKAEAAEAARLLRAEKQVAARELDRCRRAVRESKQRLVRTNEELLGLRATLGAVQAEAGDLRRRVEALGLLRSGGGEDDEDEEEEQQEGI